MAKSCDRSKSGSEAGCVSAGHSTLAHPRRAPSHRSPKTPPDFQTGWSNASSQMGTVHSHSRLVHVLGALEEKNECVEWQLPSPGKWRWHQMANSSSVNIVDSFLLLACPRCSILTEDIPLAERRRASLVFSNPRECVREALARSSSVTCVAAHDALAYRKRA